MTPRARLEAVLAPELIDAVEALIAERVGQALAERVAGSSASPWLALDEAAAYLRVSERTLERRIVKARIRSTTIGRRRLLHRDDLDALARGGGGGDSANRSTPPPLEE